MLSQASRTLATMTTDFGQAPDPLVVRVVLDTLYPSANYRPEDVPDMNGMHRGMVLRVAELLQGYEVERRHLQQFAVMVADLDRNERGRHEGDSDSTDPSGQSQGNPSLRAGDVLGYSLHGAYRYVMPERGQRHKPEAWKVDVRG